MQLTLTLTLTLTITLTLTLILTLTRCKTLIIATLSPSVMAVEESFSTLK